MEYIRKGSYATFEFELTDGDGNPIDLSYVTVKFIVKKNRSDDDGAAVLSDEIENSPTHRIMFQFDATEIENINDGDYYVALKMFKENDLNDEIWNDKLRIEKETFNE